MYYKTKEEYIKDVGIICGEQDTLPFYGVEITEEEYNTLLAELEAKWEQEAEENAPKNPYGIDDTTYNNIIDDYTSSITEEVASNGY